MNATDIKNLQDLAGANGALARIFEEKLDIANRRLQLQTDWNLRQDEKIQRLHKQLAARDQELMDLNRRVA